jgi:hypothetical protein
MSLSLTNAGLMSGSVQTNDGYGSPSAVEPDRLWQMPTETVRPRPAHGSGAGFQRNTDEAEASATSGNPIAQFSKTTPVTGRSESPVARWPAHKRFFGRLRQKLARYVRRTRAASESERMLHLTTKLFVEWYNEAVT